MTITRTYFDFEMRGVTLAETSAPINGEIHQMRWVNAADTGQVATLQISLLPDMSDTGLGFLIHNRASGNLATQFTFAPRQSTHDLDGAADHTDTGTPAAPAPYVCANDRLKVVIVPVDTGIVLDAKLYVWVKN